MADVFVTGSTGYMGSRLVPALLAAGHRVRALARARSAGRLATPCDVVIGNALDASSFADRVAPADAFVQLVGVAHPAPWKGRAFQDVDLPAARAGVEAARAAGVRHFVYVSVAQPAPVMRAYVEARAKGEALVRAAGFPSATILRPWYVVGPGHQWARLLAPAYWAAERFPSTREAARRLGLVTLREMVAALARAVAEPPAGVRVVEVPEIRSSRSCAAVLATPAADGS